MKMLHAIDAMLRPQNGLQRSRYLVVRCLVFMGVPTLNLYPGCCNKTFEELRHHAREYQKMSEEEQEKAFKESGIRWYAFLKLPYFNPLRMAVLDPMHNILLGEFFGQGY